MKTYTNELRRNGKSPKIEKSVSEQFEMLNDLSQSKASPIIIPKSIRTVSCTIIESSTPEHSKEADYVSTAKDFLLNIDAAEKSSCSSSALLKSSGSSLEVEEKLGCSCIDLSDFPGRIDEGPLKEELNSEFAALYPYFRKNLTLSKLVNLREKLYNLCTQDCIQPFTVAVAWNCFLRLLGYNLITKKNRKDYIAVCCILAFKFFEEHKEFKSRLRTLLKRLKGLGKKMCFKSMLKKEFKVYSSLRFSLYVDDLAIKNTVKEIISRI